MRDEETLEIFGKQYDRPYVSARKELRGERIAWEAK
jgi:hypothetical protein